MSVWGDVGNFITGNTGTAAASSDLQQIPDILKQYYNPYLNAGNAEISPYQNTLNSLMLNPTGFVNNIMGSYKPSQMNINNMNQMQTASNNAAAAGGTLGTGEQIEQVQKNANNLSMADQQQYLQSILQPFYQGLQGARGIFDTGFNAARDISGNLVQNADDEAAMDYQRGQNTDRTIGGAIAGVASHFGL